jgi:hypothetical protein
MHIRIRTLFELFILTGVIFVFCSENPHQLIVNVLEEQSPGTVKDTTLYAMQDTSYFITSKVSTRSSLRLLLGSAYGIQARPIFRFTDFSSFPDSLQIDSVSLKLYAFKNISSDESIPFSATVYPIDSSSVWSSNTDSVWNEYPNNIDMTKPLGETEIFPSDTGEFVFHLNDDGLDFVRLWADTATSIEDNAGMIIEFQQASFLQYFYAITPLSTDLPDPELLLFSGDTTYAISANFDAFIYEGEIPRIENRDYVSSLNVYNSLYKFDLKNFVANQPEGISILSANIQIPVDHANSLIDKDYGIDNQIILNLKSEFGSSSVEVDSTVGKFTIVNSWAEDSSYVEVNASSNRKTLAALIKTIVNDTESPESFVLSFVSSTSSSVPPINAVDFYSYLAYYKRTEQDPAKRIRLIITYWVPAKPRL